MGQVGLEWTVAGFGDFSGNPNESDMLLRNSNTGQFEFYDISNNAIISAGPMGQVGQLAHALLSHPFSGVTSLSSGEEARSPAVATVAAENR